LLGGFRGGRIGESEDVLGEREEGIFRVLGIGTHLELRGGRWWTEWDLRGEMCGLYWFGVVEFIADRL